jgi:hypothetical protein
MKSEVFNKIVNELKVYIEQTKRLPRVWAVRFTDGSDMRLWFDYVSKIREYDKYLEDINKLLNDYNYKILKDVDKEKEFLEYISVNNEIPMYGQAYFSDNSDMNNWYRIYIKDNRDYEKEIMNSLKEYQELDIAQLNSVIIDEFIAAIKKLKRIPNHGEYKVSTGIDIRVLFDKLDSFDPQLVERLLLHLQTYNNHALSKEERVSQLLSCVSSVGYLPYLQEFRFTDGTEMFTWYSKYKNIIPNLETDIHSVINNISGDSDFGIVPEENDKHL